MFPTRLVKGIGYIKVSKFGRTTYNEFITAIAKLKEAGCSSFVIDLRGNTGGYMDAAINMVNEFMPEGRLIVYTEGKAFPVTMSIQTEPALAKRLRSLS